jgi:hypothetical protein
VLRGRSLKLVQAAARQCVPLPRVNIRCFSKYLLQYFSIYYQMLTLNLSFFYHLRYCSRRNFQQIFYIPLFTRRGKFYCVREKKKVETIFCAISKLRNFHNHVLIFESFFFVIKWNINGSLNLQRFLLKLILWMRKPWLKRLSEFNDGSSLD